jgi:hypothetical protein
MVTSTRSQKRDASVCIKNMPRLKSLSNVVVKLMRENGNVKIWLGWKEKRVQMDGWILRKLQSTKEQGITIIITLVLFWFILSPHPLNKVL